jgi:hypothetical protein
VFSERLRWIGLTCVLHGACGGTPASERGGGSTGTDPDGGDATEPSAHDGGQGTSGSAGTEASGSPASESSGETGDTVDPPPSNGDELPWDPDQLDRVCERNNQDPIALRLCGISPPSITGMPSLYAALQASVSPSQVGLLGNSTSVSARKVSALNPRVLVNLPFDNDDIGAVAFSRGEQMVELVGYDPVADVLNFYALPFFQACNDDTDGCSLADRYTEAVESDWEKWTLYQDIDVVNTPLDCLTCHQPGGPDSPRLLLNRQSTEPWMHWFPSFAIQTPGDTQSTTVLTPLFAAMHGADETYAGVPIDLILPPAPFAAGIVSQQLLENYWVPHGGPPPPLTALGQPYEFDSAAVEADLAGGSTATWDDYYTEVVAGLRLPIPYHDHDVTDPDKRTAVVDSYNAVVSGAADPDTLLDPADVFAPETEVALSFRPRPDASAEEVLHHVCQRCHNDRLDQTLSRANFNAEHPDALTKMQRATALARVMLPDGAEGKMPPRRFATLEDDALETLADFLSH